MTSPLLFIVTGSRGAGKTTFCQQLVGAAREAGWNVAGLISTPVFDGSQRVAIQAEDLRGSEARTLAVRDEERPTPGTRVWRFEDSAIEWGNAVLAASTPCDLLVVDELGPLELDLGGGLQAGLNAVASRNYAIALVVVRPELLGQVLLRWDEANLVEIDTPEDSTRKARVLINQLF